MSKLTNLGRWREGKEWTQADLADKIAVPRPTYQKMESGVGPIPPKIQAKIQKLGYAGAWPREEAEEKPAAEGVTREEFAELKGAMQAENRLLRESLEKAFELIRDLAFRLPKESRPKGY